MSREGWIRRAGPAAMLGGALYFCAFGAAYLIYGVFEEQARGTFFGQHAFIHMLDVPMFALLAMGAVGVLTPCSPTSGTVPARPSPTSAGRSTL